MKTMLFYCCPCGIDVMEVSENTSASQGKFYAGLDCLPLVEFRMLDLVWFGRV